MSPLPRIRPLTFAHVVVVALAFAVCTANAQVCSAPSFTYPAVYQIPSSGNHRLATADFDADGRPDLAVLDLNFDTVTIYTKVNGTDLPSTNSYSTAHSPGTIAAGDFNGDNRPDLIIGNASGVQLFLNDGTGLFFSAGNFAPPASPRSTVVGDFNGDGKLDVAATSGFGNSVSVLLGDGQGGFSITPNTSANVGNLVAADFNGDGKLDLAGTGNPTLVLLGKGDGTFTRQSNSCASATVSATDGIAAGDVTGDGKLDIVVTNILAATIQVLPGDNSGCFGPAINLNVSESRPGSVTLGDLNKDGKLDIVAVTTVILTDGAGGFGTPFAYGTGSSGAPTVNADFDADGNLDLASVGTTSVGILFGDGQGRFKFAGGPAGRGIYGMRRGDFNGDGKQDLALATNAPGGGVALVLGDGTGNFTAPIRAAAPTISTHVVVADFTGDSKLDVASLNIGDANRVLSVLPGDGNGQLGAAITTTLVPNGERRDLVGGDFNADGKADLLTINNFGGINAGGSISILLGDGTGHFSTPTTFVVNGIASNPRQVGIADFNGDNKVDLAIPSGFGFSVLIGDGSGGFGTSSLNTTANAGSILTADFNGDGKTDLAMIGENEAKASVLLGNGVGGFGSPLQTSVAGFAQDLTAADFNGDGKLDLAISSQKGTGVLVSTASVFLGDGTGSFSSLSTRLVDGNPGWIVSGDFNIDGRNDLITANETSDTFTEMLNTCGAPVSSIPTIQFGAPSFTVGEGGKSVTVTVTRTGSTAGAASVDYATSNGSASSRSDYTQALGTLRFADGESVKSFIVLITDDTTAESHESLNVALSGAVGATLGAPSQATVVILENDGTIVNTNPIDTAGFFVRQHYLDFLNREPDQSGLDFWTSQITSCGSNAQCTEVRRVDVSASFFLSIEFQQTGYLVERFYKVAYGDAMGNSTFGSSHQLIVPIVRFNEFLKDTQRIGQGVIVLQPGWEQLLENNKQAYALEFVQTTRFTTALPTTMTPAQFVDRLNQNGGGVLSPGERQAAVSLFGGAEETSNVNARAQAMRMVTEDQDLYSAEYNRAFVLAEYFGYLRRNPNDAPESTLDYTGYDFWLTKLNQFNGNYINAEMVKAFLSSIEYRQRFGP